MLWLICAVLLLVADIGVVAHHMVSANSIQPLLTGAPGLIGLSSAVWVALMKNSLRAYLCAQRLYYRTLGRGDVSEWRICARFSGNYDPGSLERLASAIISDARFSARTEYESQTTVTLCLGDKLVFSLTVDPIEGEIDLQTKFVEVTFASAEDKLDRVFAPLLEKLKNELRPSRDSYELDLRFSDSNPFYALYISRLRPEQIDKFNITILPAGMGHGDLQSVVVTKDVVTVAAVSTSAFIELAKKFVLLRASSSLLKGTAHA